MALIFEVVYPNGERAVAIGYHGKSLVVDEVPPGPESCYRDEIEVDFSVPDDEPLPVRRVLGGPGRPTIHVRVEGCNTEGERDTWMDERDAEGWHTRVARNDSSIIWCVAGRDDVDITTLERAGAVIIARS